MLVETPHYDESRVGACQHRCGSGRMYGVGFCAKRRGCQVPQRYDVGEIDRPGGQPRQGLKGSYSKLGYQQGWPLVVREDLAAAGRKRTANRKSLVAFVHLTDMHMIDAQSPAQVPYLRKFTSPAFDLTDAFRCQMAFTNWVAESMVQRVNSLPASPVTGTPFSFAISTGDNGDGKQKNELQNYINVLDGGPMVSDSSGRGYVGCQDDTLFAEDDPSVTDAERQAIYSQYYHPNPVPAPWAGRIQPDQFKTDYGFPDFPGILIAAGRDFRATGLRMPWYSGNGNHDGLVHGNFNLEGGTLEFMNRLAEGNLLILDLPPSVSPLEFLICIETGDLTCIEKLIDESPSRQVPANPNRKIHELRDFVQAHLDSPAVPGPVGHGFTVENLQSGKLYYGFDVAPNVRGIMMDTVNHGGGADGTLGTIQAAWIEEELRKVSSRYYDETGREILTGNPDKLVVLFSHHNLLTMANSTANPPDPVLLTPAQIEALVHRYPNVVLWVNGHSHVNRVWAHADPLKRSQGFWEVNTASHIDFPQQARTVEIVDNQDGTLSFFGILIDHMAPPASTAGDTGALGLASISRELSANDPLFSIPFQIGAPTDRNVELILKKPF